MAMETIKTILQAEQVRLAGNTKSQTVPSSTDQTSGKSNPPQSDLARLYWERVRGRGTDEKGQATQVRRNRTTPPKCPFCNDAGYVHPDVDYPISDERFGKLVKCPYCFDTTSSRIYLQQRANLPPKYKAADFANFHYTTEARVTAAPLAQDMIDRRAGWLTLWGGYGSGKSYLGAAIVNYAIGKGTEARFWEMAALLDHLRDAYDPKKAENFSQLYHDICQCPVLVVDECDVFKTTDWAYQQFRQLVSARYARSNETVTIWILNPQPRPGAKGFPAELDFLASRMSEYKIISMNDGDMRPL